MSWWRAKPVQVPIFRNEEHAIQWAAECWAYSNVLHWTSLGVLGAGLMALEWWPLWTFPLSLAVSSLLHAGWEWQSRRSVAMWHHLAQRAAQQLDDVVQNTSTATLRRMAEDPGIVGVLASDALAKREKET